VKTGLYARLVAERTELDAEVKGIRKAADKSDLTDDQRERLTAIRDRKEVIATDIALLDDERDEILTAPAEPDTAATGAPTPFRSLGEQLHAVAQAALRPDKGVDPRLGQINAAAQGANELVGSEGGFLVQTDFSQELLRLVHETGTLSSRTDRRPIGPNANGMKVNYINENSRADGSRSGGVRAYWTGEAGSLTASKPSYGQIELNLAKLTGLYYATDEEIGDVTNLEANATREFADEFGFKVDDAIVRGTGAGMPLGWLNAGATVSVSKETGQAAATIVSENVEKMYARMFARSIGDAVWYINQDCWPQLFQLHHVIGTGGVPMYVPAGGLSTAPFGTLLGRPVQPIEQAATVGTVGDISFVDLSQYLTIEKGGIAAASSIHVQFTTDETAFRWVLRTNGRPKRDTALTPFKGSATQSAFVTLATRS
jgi:HK97 family phage major capsid protein